MKDVSLRPKKQLMGLFEAVQNMESLPTNNRNAVIERALDVALTSSYVNWQAVSEVLVEESFTGSVPTHVVLKVDPEKFFQVNDQIKQAFTATKITIPYTLKLLLTLYFIHLKQQREPASKDEALKEISIPQKQINTLLLKNEYEQSIYSGKKRLFEMCKVLLKQSPELHKQLLHAGRRDLEKFNDIFDLSLYLSNQETNPTLTYLGKVLAGLFILFIESTTQPQEIKSVLDGVVRKLETEFMTIGSAITQNEGKEYYKDVYAKMMGGKI